MKHPELNDEAMGWFCVSNYETFIDLPLSGWASELELRYRLYEYLENEKFYDNQVLMRTFDEKFSFVTSRSRLLTGPGRALVLTPNHAGDWSSSDGRPKASVRALSVGEVKEKANGIPADIPEEAVIQNIGGGNHRAVTLEVIASAPRDTLISQFEELIDSLQKDLDTKKRRKFSPSEMRSWLDNMLVPYIDIDLYARRRNMKLTHLDIAGLLFSNDALRVDIGKRVRVTVKPAAEKMMTLDSISSLKGQIDADGDLPPIKRPV
jgi:hypothetical protein